MLRSLIILLVLTPYLARPQDTLVKKELKPTDKKKFTGNLKFTGYLHAQFQMADTAGISSYAGGDFNPNVDKRFSVRRGRLKAAYIGEFSLYTIQVDVTEKKIGIRDAYARITDKWLKMFHIQAGVFDRPFGFEIGYSSSQRETPERGRMSQILFPGEKDLGAMLVFNPHKDHKLNYLKLEVGLFNGSGHEASDFDSFKDLIGRLRIDRKTESGNVRYGLGISYLNGGWMHTKPTSWEMGSDSAGVTSFVSTTDSGMIGSLAGKSMFGGDFQFSIDWAAGTTTLRGEYVTGTTAGTLNSLKNLSALPSGDNYFRDFNGAYFYFIQNLGKTKHQLVAKYDWFDPNASVSGNDIGKAVTSEAKATVAADLKYSTLGLGWNYQWDDNLKFTVYYDAVTNETSSNLAGYGSDKKDNVLTLRLQFRF